LKLGGRDGGGKEKRRSVIALGSPSRPEASVADYFPPGKKGKRRKRGTIRLSDEGGKKKRREKKKEENLSLKGREKKERGEEKFPSISSPRGKKARKFFLLNFIKRKNVDNLLSSNPRGKEKEERKREKLPAAFY